MEKKYDKWGRELYPMTAEERKIYDRLKEKYKGDRGALGLIEAELLGPTERRNWEECEGILSLYF